MGRLVEEDDLDVSLFRCCGDENLYPFGCPGCGRLMVFCYECDTLYDDLNDLTKQDVEVNSFNPREPIFVCPHCGHGLEFFFTRDGLYKVSREVWLDAGAGHLLA